MVKNHDTSPDPLSDPLPSSRNSGRVNVNSPSPDPPYSLMLATLSLRPPGVSEKMYCTLPNITSWFEFKGTDFWGYMWGKVEFYLALVYPTSMVLMSKIKLFLR